MNKYNRYSTWRFFYLCWKLKGYCHYKVYFGAIKKTLNSIVFADSLHHQSDIAINQQHDMQYKILGLFFWNSKCHFSMTDRVLLRSFFRSFVGESHMTRWGHRAHNNIGTMVRCLVLPLWHHSLTDPTQSATHDQGKYCWQRRCQTGNYDHVEVWYLRNWTWKIPGVFLLCPDFFLSPFLYK